MTLQHLPRYQLRSIASDVLPDSLRGADVAIVGCAVDDRGTASIGAIRALAREVHTFSFDAEKHSLYLDDVETRLDRLKTVLSGANRVVLDATTLGVGEILQLLLAISRAGMPAVEFLYIEPKTYTRREPSGGHAQQRDFSLSTNCKFSSVQGFAHEYDANRMAAHVFMLGFEPARMLNAIEQRGYYDPCKTTFHAIVGVPAFQVGWEANSIRPHLPALEELDISESCISYSQANSIREGYLSLWELYRSLGDEQGCFYVSPLGTKPHGVAAALFLLETKSSDAPTSLYYDHPVKKPQLSSEMGSWHHVIVNMA